MKTIIISIGGNSGNIVLDAANEIPEDFKVYRYDPYSPDESDIRESDVQNVISCDVERVIIISNPDELPTGSNIATAAVRIAKEKKKQTIYALFTLFISKGNDAYNKTEAVQESIKSFSPDVFLRFDGSELISEYGNLPVHKGMKQIALKIWREIAKYL